jgi:ribonuclease P protein component
MPKAFAFPKHYRLSGQKNIEALLHNGEAFFVFPYRIVYSSIPHEKPSVVVTIAAPKRKLKKANQRNSTKRIAKEVYRLNQQPLHDLAATKQIAMQLFISYVHTEIVSFADANKSMEKIIAQLLKRHA